MPLRCARTAYLPLAAALLAAAPAGAFAKDRPGTPTDVRVQAEGPTTVTVSFTNTASEGERVVFELEQTVNGRRISPDAEKLLSSRFRASFNPGQISGRVAGLAAGSENCFRVWSRTKPTSRFILDNTGVRSEHPSGWTCELTRPNAPLAPLDVNVRTVAHVTDKLPRVSWRTPDQSDYRGIDEFVIERKDGGSAGQPWLTDRKVAGPAGAQTVSTRLEFSESATLPPRDGRYAYRVCSLNKGGKTCSNGVDIAVTLNPAIAGVGSGAGRAAAIESKRDRYSATAAAPAVEATASGARNARTAALPAQPPQPQPRLQQPPLLQPPLPQPNWTPPTGAPIPAPSPAQRTWMQPSTPATPAASVQQAPPSTLAPASSLRR